MSIQQASIKGFVSGAESATNKLPKKVRDRLAYLPDVGDLSTPPPTPDSLASVAEGEPEVFFPGLERAAEKLVEAKTITPQDYYALSAEARKQAFTISGEITQESVEKIREILAEQMSESGVSLDAFERDVEERLGELPINEAHLEGVFRNAINSAYSEGQEHVLSSGIVSDEFPYRAYHAIRDARTRHDHRALEKFGIGGTNVYLASDPFWKRFQPPFYYSCRCAWTGLSVEDAAYQGVSHAKEWLANVEAAKENGTFSGWYSEYMPTAEYVDPPADKLPETWND